MGTLEKEFSSQWGDKDQEILRITGVPGVQGTKKPAFFVPGLFNLMK